MATMGRPRQFDRSEALRNAMSVFWRYGYESTSMAQLKQAMGGISAASLYAAFGSKEALYKEAVELYMATSGDQVINALNNTEIEPTEAIAMALRNAAREQTNDKGPHGCMVVLSAINCSPENEHIREAMKAQRRHVRLAFQSRIAQGIASGAVPADADAEALSTYFSTVLNGISIQARDGVTLDVLNKVIDVALTGLDFGRK